MPEDIASLEELADLRRRLNGTTSYVLTSSVPLALQSDEGLKCAGTGTLFEVAGKYFILTAQHVCEEMNSLFIPAHGNFGDRIIINDIILHIPKNREDIDVAAIELSDIIIFELLKRNYRFFGLDRVDFRGPSEKAIFIGYLKQSYPLNGTGEMRSTTITTDIISEKISVNPPAITGLDFFYRYSQQAYKFDNDGLLETRSPELRGMSGASVWEMLRVDGTWSPNKSIYITGIEVAYVHSRYARVQSWWAIARLLCMISQDIGEKFSIKTGFSVEKLTAKGEDVPKQTQSPNDDQSSQ